MRMVMDYLSRGKVVAANFDLTGTWWDTARKMGKATSLGEPQGAYLWSRGCRERALRYDNMDDLYDYTLPGTGEDRGLLVYDEGGLNLNKRTRRTREKRDELRHDNELATMQFYINMRKRGWTCLILAHSAKHLDDQVQDLGGSIIRLRNFARVKLPIIGVGVTKNPRFLAIHYWPEVGAITKRELYGLNLKIARHYQSMEEFSYMPETQGLRLQAPLQLCTAGVPTFEEWDSGTAAARTAGAPAAERGRTAGADGDAPTGSSLEDWIAGRV